MSEDIEEKKEEESFWTKLWNGIKKVLKYAWIGIIVPVVLFLINLFIKKSDNKEIKKEIKNIEKEVKEDKQDLKQQENTVIKIEKDLNKEIQDIKETLDNNKESNEKRKEDIKEFLVDL